MDVDPKVSDVPVMEGDTLPEDSGRSSGESSQMLTTGDQVAGRFVIDGVLGRGSSGEVLSAKDLSLDRVIAMKVLRGAGGPAIARFMREARITARLDHPNVPPVHTLDFLPDGGLVFTMRRLQGISLGEAIRRARSGAKAPAIASVNALVSLGLRLCEALSRAHFLGVIHRDVKPDNIMLGEHGELALVDWGESRLIDDPSVVSGGSAVGTPAYMSPEQARGEPADASSDIYALGATLHHALTGELPMWDADPEEFWRRKRIGSRDPLPPSAARLPRPLLAILAKAMAPERTGRYASAADLATDLERFQAGLAVAAYRASAVERLGWWFRRNGRVLATTAIVLAVGLAAAGLLWRERVRQLADWGPPVLSEDFKDPAWRQRWFEEEPGQWAAADGVLVSTGGRRSLLVLDRVLAGAVAVEYVGEMQPGHPPGDLSVIWTEEASVAPGWKLNHAARGLMVQAGAFDNYFCAIYRQPDGARLDQRPFRLVPGVRHRFRVEIDGERIGMWVDGNRVLDAEDRFPIGAGRICLYAYYPGKAFSEVRVYQKRLPEVASVLAIGQALMRRDLPVQAADAFREVAESHPGKPLAAQARYEQGLALFRGGDSAGAALAWQRLPAGEFADRAAAYGLDADMAAGRIAVACSRLAELHRRSPGVRRQLQAQWQSWAGQVYDARLCDRDPAALEKLVAVKLGNFPGHAGSDVECAKLLNQLGRCQEVVDRFPGEVSACTAALLRLGRTTEVLTRFADSPESVNFARLALGRFDEVADDERMDQWFREIALCQWGRLDRRQDRLDRSDGLVLMWQGRAEEVIASGASGGSTIIALASLGRWDEALSQPPSWESRPVRMLAGRTDPRLGGPSRVPAYSGARMIRLHAAGDNAMAQGIAADLAAGWPDWDAWIDHLVVAPIVAGDRAALRRQLEFAQSVGQSVCGRRAQVLAAYALGDGDRASFAAAPCAGEATLWLAVGEALRAELHGDPAAIRAAWAAYRALPWASRLSRYPMPEPSLEALAAWRATAP